MSNKPLKDYDACALLAMLIYGEGRGESVEGQIAIGNVVRNRVMHPNWWGRSWRTVMLKPYQFSCFLEDDPNLPKMMEAWHNRCENYSMKQAAWIALGIIDHRLRDNSREATHYYSTSIMPPKWALGHEPVVQIGNHKFFKLLA